MEHKFTVIFDAGHGGTALAAGSTPNNAVGTNGLLEKDLTLKIAKIAAAKLNSNGFQTLLTRDDDRNLSIAERARKSRESGADAFISIHFNGSRNSDTDGTEVYVSSSSDKNDFNLADELLKNVSHTAATKGKGVCTADFTILKGDFHVTKTAACLIEMAYLTNPHQAQKLLLPEYVENLATAVAKSVATYANRTAYSASFAENTVEKTIADISKEHADPKNVPIDFPEPGKGTDTIQISVPNGLKFSRWEVEVTAMSTGAGYEVKQPPKAGAEGNHQITVDWWHLPYGKIKYKFKAYASPDGKSTAIEKVVFDKAGWMEKAKDQISQGVPLKLAVKGEKAKQIYEAIQKYQAAHQAKQAGEVAIAMEPVTITVVVLVGIVIFGILVALGLLTLGAIIKMALDKGYNVKDTKFKAGVGEGQLRQDHEIAFNLTRPVTSTSQSFPLDYEDDLDARYFQPLDTVALGGNPVFDIKRSVGKSGDNKEEDVFSVKKRLIDLGFDWITLNKKIDAATIFVIKLFQSIINGKNAVSGDGTIEVGKNTYLWMQAINAPRWQMMPSGSQAEGFFNFELSDTKDTHDFGTNWIAETIKSAAAYYRDNYLKTNTSAALLTVNDVSLPHGGNTPDHEGHEAGLACDLQLPRTDGKAGGINIKIEAQKRIYDQKAARAVLKALKAQPLVTRIFFNDKDLISEGLCAYSTGHDHHIHFEVKPPARGAIETDGMGYYHSGGRLYQGSYQDDIDYQTHALDTACGNSGGITRDEKYVVFDPMSIESDRPNKKENVFLRWCDIPKNKCEIDVVVHFHGWNITQETRFFEYVVKNSGLDLLKPDRTLTRKQPTLCILPFGKFTGNVDKRKKFQFPFFINDRNALQQLINFSLEFLAKTYLPDDYKRSGNPFKQGRLILTAHSGGGEAVSAILGFNKYDAGKVQLKYDVSEVHLFDSTYGGQTNTINWAKYKIDNDSKLSAAELHKKRGALRVIYTPFHNNCSNHGTAGGSKQIDTGIKETLAKSPQFKPWYRIQATRIEHNSVPKTFGFQLLADASSRLDDTFAEAYLNSCYKKDPAKYGLEAPFTQQSLEYEEPDYFAESEENYMNY